MNKRWLLILALISLSFNLAFIGSFLYLRFVHLPKHSPMFHSPEHPHHFRDGKRGGPFGEMGDRLPKDIKLKDAFRDFHQSKRELMHELAQNPIDEAKVAVLLEQSLAKHSALERKLGEKLLELRKTMSADEAKEFFEKRMHRNRGKRMEYMQENQHRNPNRRIK